MATAGIVIIGDEILSGKFAEENAAFLVRELRALGVALARIELIPDDAEDIGATVRRHAERYDHVFTSGGIGPTHDDLTIASIASAFGVAVVRHPELEQRIRAYWGEALAPANLRLADVPEGTALLWGSGAPWPVISYRNVYILPGVPALFQRGFGLIKERFRTTPVVLRRVWIDREEGSIEPALTAVVRAHASVKLGSYPRYGEPGYKVIVTLEGADAATVDAAVAALRAAIGDGVVREE